MDDPHIIYGCDYCTETEIDGSPRRIRGPFRYTLANSEDVDCCAACWSVLPCTEQIRFAKIPSDPAPPPAPPPPVHAPAPVPSPQTYALWLIPTYGAARHAADSCIIALSVQFGTEPFRAHVALASGFDSLAAAEAAAHVVAPLFRDATLSLGALSHEVAPLRRVSAAVGPSALFGQALLAAERVKKDRSGGRVAGFLPAPRLPLLCPMHDVDEADAVRAAEGAAPTLAGSNFAALAVAVMDASAHPDEFCRWEERAQVPV